MVFEPVTIGTFAGLSKIFEYLRPTCSPYLLAISTSFFCFLFLKDRVNDISPEKVYYFIIPSLIFFVVFSIVPLLFYLYGSGIVMTDDEKVDITEQFKFSRSVFLSVIFVSLYLLVVDFGTLNWIFYISYFIITCNLGVFSVYLLTREVHENSGANRNLIQIALINSLILLLMSQYGPVVDLRDSSAWMDCRATFTITYDGKELDTSGDAKKETSSIEGNDCSIGNEQFISDQISEDYPNIQIMEKKILFHLSFSFLIFISSYILSLLYFVFWILRIGSVVRLRLVQ